MRFSTGIHPKHWHRGAWLVALLIAALAILLTHRSTGGIALAAEPPQHGAAAEPAVAAPGAPTARPEGNGYVSEIVNSYTVGPAEFFALDLPTRKEGAQAVQLTGTVSTTGKGKDIIVRLFKGSDYDRWLKQKSGRKPQALWTSPRARTLTVNQSLPPGEPIVLLLDNGFSVRTPKQVSCQLQLHYERSAGVDVFDTEGSNPVRTGGSAVETVPDNLPPPRANTEEEMPPPPPPPPSGY